MSCRQQIDGSYVFIHLDTLCLLVRVFSPFTFSVIIERYGFRVIVMSVGFMCSDISGTLWSLQHFTHRVPLRISCRAGLVVTNSFSFCLFGKTFISPSSLNDRLAG